MRSARLSYRRILEISTAARSARVFQFFENTRFARVWCLDMTWVREHFGRFSSSFGEEKGRSGADGNRTQPNPRARGIRHLGTCDPVFFASFEAKKGAFSGNRTHNQRIKSPLLCLIELRACNAREVVGWTRLTRWRLAVASAPIGTAGVEPAAS